MTDTLDARVTDFLTDVLGAMGLTVDVALEETPDAIRVNVTGAGAETLLRRQGETLDALQVVVNTAFRREERGDRHYLVDALSFRKGKDDELRETARTLIETARASGVPQEMGPLNPYARRLVHLVVADTPGMSSESIGDAFLKTVVISAAHS
ncbi:MAG TPA: R3H domain-containing nucleic acid-binding protein [Vicinamibacterales bacterium]|nr:R3H domain-containing nucleic acid-binding protein [Vicinamibacterales bacterium]